jgi:hypothetical protein
MKLGTLIAGLAGACALAAPLAGSAQPNDNWLQNGVVSSHNDYTFTLADGQTVFMHDGTVINPTGTDLQPGMRVTIYGHYDENNNIDADEVDVGRARTYYERPYDNPNMARGYYDQYGDWHYRAPYGPNVAPRGFYDQNGNWHPFVGGP